tara:strand:- start:733 stop:2091 length:1359 start_codon:yes stop_codon:yes gene_type:complete
METTSKKDPIIYISSKDSNKKLEQINYDDLKSNKHNLNKIIINEKELKQEFMGFGGAFTEASASVYSKLPRHKRNEIITSYFGDVNGNSYSIGRTHINSCDFSLGNYAYCEEEDESLGSFSIEHDKSIIIPFIKDAMQLSKIPLKLLASPWSPPAWMKTNGEMNNGGKLKLEYRKSWANYYCKYIKAYEEEGISIWGISVQNEPAAKQTWDSCLYTAEEERDFVKNYLGPALHASNLENKKLIIWDHNRDEMLFRAETILGDPDANKYVWGTGFHWYEQQDHFDDVQKVHDRFPDKQLIFTEGCQEGGPHIGSWKLGERYAVSIINDLNRWTVAWLDWNLILDETGGPNHVGNLCSAPIIIKDDNILYQSSYYYIGHFSRFIKRGDHIIDSETQSEDLLSLSSIDSNKDIKTVVLNKNKKDLHFELVQGNDTYPICIPARSILTIILKNQQS